MNPLNDHPEVRKALYTVQWVVSGVMLCLGVAFAAMESVNTPDWYVVASSVLSALWAYTGLTAAQNVHTAVAPPAATTPTKQEAEGQLPLFEVDESSGDVKYPQV